MATSTRRRGLAITALALAGGTTLAAIGAAAPAGAAKNSAPAYYQGVTSANVLGVAVHLPAALPSLPSVPKDLALNLIGVSGNALHNTLGHGAASSSTAVSTLASGSLVNALPSSLGLKSAVKATLAGQRSATKTDIEVPADPIAHLRVGFLKANAAETSNSASALLNDGYVAKLGQLLNTTAAGNAAVAQIQQSLQNLDVTGQTQNVLTQIKQALAPVISADPSGTTAQVADALEATLTQVVNQVQSIVANLGNTAMVTLDTLDAQQSITPAGNAAQAAASVNLASLNVLDGLLTVKGFVSKATAIANGKPGGAHASYSGHAPIVAVGTPALTATLDENGLSLSDVSGLPASVTLQVDSALAQLQSVLNSLLSAVGVHIAFVPGHINSVKSDGTFAAATGPEYDIVLSNPVDHSALMTMGLGHGTTASIAAAQAPIIHTVSNPQAGALPHTGANLPLLGGIALALLVGAGIIRRRVRG